MTRLSRRETGRGRDPLGTRGRRAPTRLGRVPPGEVWDREGGVVVEGSDWWNRPRL